MFKLNERLEADTFEVCDLELSKVLLMNDTTYPWLILVPRQEGLREFTDLSVDNQTLLMQEITKVSKVLEGLTGAFKMNVGALGNVVSQLHIHVIARFENDPAWPAPVWGHGPAVAYGDNIRTELVKALSEKLA